MAIIATGSKTIIDLSDGKSLSVYLGANQPRTQINDVNANTIEGSNIKAGAITTNHVASNFGETLDLSSNTGINQRVEQVYSDMDELVGFRIEIISTSDILSEDIQATTLTAPAVLGSMWRTMVRSGP